MTIADARRFLRPWQSWLCRQRLSRAIPAYRDAVRAERDARRRRMHRGRVSRPCGEAHGAQGSDARICVMARTRLREKLRAKQGGRCCYCNERMTPPRAKPLPTSETLEHLHRRDDGGGNEHDNMALACHRCNFGRGTVDWFTYTSYRRGELWGAF